MLCSKSPQPLYHFHICPKPKVKLGPTDLIYPAPPSSLDIATARNPNQFSLTDGISVSLMGSRSHRDGLANSLLPIAIISVPPRYAVGPTEFGDLCVTATFCVEAIYTPPPSSPLEREPSVRAYSSNIHFLRENHLLMC